MNSAMTYAFTTSDSAGTRQVGRRLSRFLSGGETIELISDLGGGKTTFVQGLMAGLSYAGPVTSPTFTLSNVYEVPSGGQVHHYDLYRLGEAGVLAEELAEDIGQPDIITIVEWPSLAGDLLPKDRLTITFEVTADTARRLVFSANGPRSAHLIKELKSDSRA